VFQALTRRATKEATLVVELMARFDEASNIRWARSMEDAGVQVFHGVVGLKPLQARHARPSRRGRRHPPLLPSRHRQLQPRDSPLLHDLSMLTCDPEITAQVHMVFNYLTAHAEIDDYRPLLVAPLTMAESFSASSAARPSTPRPVDPATSSPR